MKKTMNLDAFSPYGSMDGLAFKMNGADEMREVNLKKAMEDLRTWCIGRGNRDAALNAMQYIALTRAGSRGYLNAISVSFSYDEAVDTEIIRLLCTPAYNGLIAHLNR